MIVLAASVLGVSSAGLGQDTRPARKADQQRIDRLIEQLGDERWRAREAATRELAEIGVPAVVALRKAFLHRDAEIRARAHMIVKGLSGKLARSMTARREQLARSMTARREQLYKLLAGADYDRALAAARALSVLDDTLTLNWLWVGHTAQLAGKWDESVRAYQKVLSLMDVEFHARDELPRPGPNPGRRMNPALRAQRVGPQGFMPFDRQSFISQRLSLTTWIARLQEGQLKDLKAAERQLLDGVRFMEVAGGKPRHFWLKLLRQVPRVQLVRGDLAGAVRSWQRACEYHQRTGFIHRPGQRVDVEAIARHVAAWPADKPLPKIPWIFVLTPGTPTMTLAPAEQATRDRCYSNPGGDNKSAKGYALVPKPGLEFETLTFTCDIEQFKPRYGGHLTCFLSPTGRSRSRRELGSVGYPGERTRKGQLGRVTVSRTFKVPPGENIVHIRTGSWKPYFEVHRVDVKATFRPVTPNAKRFENASWAKIKVLPEGGTLTWNGVDLGKARSRSALSPGAHRIRYEVKGRPAAELQLHVRPGGVYYAFVNLDSPFRWAQVNLYRNVTALARLKDKTWLAAWSAGNGRILLARSRDMVTWGRPELAAFNSVFSNVDPSTFEDTDGTVWLAFFSNRLSLLRRHGEGYRLWLTSTRDGRTFSPLRMVAKGGGPGASPGAARMLRGPKGRFWVFWRHLAGVGDSPADIRALRATDVGLMPNGKRLPMERIHVTVGADGAFHMVFGNGTSAIYYTRSRNGLKWTPAKVIVDGGPKCVRLRTPRLIHHGKRMVLLYSYKGPGYVTPIDPSGPALKAGTGVQITGRLHFLDPPVRITDDGIVCLLVGGRNTWLLRAKLADLP